MKKYIQPSIEVLRIQLEGTIATSLGINEGTQGDADVVLSEKRRDEMWDNDFWE